MEATVLGICGDLSLLRIPCTMGISGGNVLGWLEAAVEELVSHLMSLFAVAMNLPVARPGSIWTILDLGISVSVVFGDVDICRAA